MSFAAVVRTAGLALAAAGLMLGCGAAVLGAAPGTGSPQAQAIESILARDAELGTIRNRFSESASLAEGIGNYVEALDRLDFSACPADFAQAFRRHRDAWADSVGFFARFDELRGELHEIWQTIEQGDQGPEMRAVTQPILDSWQAVEEAARRHGSMLRD